MKILVVSNLYPPHHIGGYELGCRDVVRGLIARKHDVRVLTSTYGLPGRVTEQNAEEGTVYRWLTVNLDWTAGEGIHRYLPRLMKMEADNCRALIRAYRMFQPDIIYIWNLLRASVRLAFTAQDRSVPVAYFISDHWLARWEREHWDSWYEFWHHPAKTGARKLAASAGRGFFGAIGLLPSGSRLNLSNVQFASDYLRRDALSNGLEVATAKTIHWGIDSGFFDVDRTRQTGHAAPLRLLYAGQVRKHKGVHTAIEALARLPAPCDKVTLSIVGGSTEPKYEEELHALAAKLGVSDRVRFAGPRPRAELPGIYAEHDLLVFPSIWEEPFSITLVEAMAAGLAVVGTTRGGSAEILKDGVNALTFPANDPAACAAALVRAISEPGLLARLGASARDTVNRSFTREIMLDKIESALQAAVQTGRDRV